MKKNLDSSKFNNKLIDTFTVDHLLSKLNIDTVAVLSCLSPIDGIGLPYFKKYLNGYILQNKNFPCIPLCDDVHFQGYIVNTKKRKIIHGDSLRWNSASNPTSKLITNILFPGASDISFESFFLERKQIDSNSCGAWLVSGICSHLLSLPEIADREHAFDMCYSLLERESKATQPSMHTERFPDSYHEKQLKKFSTTEFLINALTDSPEKSEYFREIPTKGIRTNFFT